MSHARVTRVLVAAASATALLAMAACSSATTPSATTSGAVDECAAYKVYGDLTGKTISVFTSIASASEAKPHTDSYKPFEKCTGATIKYEGSRSFEKQLPIRLKAGNAPDIAYIPQPGLLATLVKDNPGKVYPAGELANTNVDTYYEASWKSYGSVDGKFYAVPVGANVKSFVWYSPKDFADKGYVVPTTWDEMMTLTQKIATDNAGTDVKPWCAGIESGDATGWPATDWVEDLMLRVNGGDVYDQWVDHTIPFNDPKVIAAIDKVGTVLKDPNYVNGGFGNVKTIATTSFTEAGAPILQGECYMHRQASFYQANWPKGTDVGEDGDVWAFYLPSMSADSKPVLGGGEFAAAFSDRPEVQAFQAYLASPEWSNAKAIATPQGGWLSANKKLDVNNLAQPVDKLSYTILTDEKAVFRFDASDLMPGAVGAGSFWTGMTDWINGKSTQEVADAIEKSWPKK
jgi:alpha-glucoside transport system substrate-binding protein